jgi:hypothetical protein
MAVRDDIEKFAANPGDALRKLEEQMRAEGQSSNIAGEIESWEGRHRLLDTAELLLSDS